MPGAPTNAEARAAVAAAAALYVVGALLISTTVLLPHVGSPFGAGAVAVVALVTAATLMTILLRGHGGLWLAFAADLWGVVLIGFLCASTGAAGSPFALIYFFAVGHAGAFQPRARFVAISLAGVIAFLLPLTYTHVAPDFGAVAIVGVVLALLTTTVVHLALGRLREQRRRLQFLIAATATLDTSLDPHQTLRKIAANALPELAELCVVDLIDEDGNLTDTVAASVQPQVAAAVEELRRTQPPELSVEHPLAQALASREPISVSDLSRAPALQAALGPVGVANEPGSRRHASMTMIPMVARGRLLGVISFVRHGRQPFGHVALLTDLTERAALAYDNARLYAERDRVAATLRRSLMPAALPQIAGLELESYFRPLGAGNEVGGDFYDVFDDGRDCWLLVGDVCGKGAEAAVLTAFLRHTIVAYARESDGPAAVLSRVNRAMLDQDFEGRFATAILARLSFGESGARLTVASAGHPGALIARAGGDAQELAQHGTLLGIFPDAAIGESSATLEPGDALALYTDGLSEAQAPARLLEAGELVGALRTSRPGSAQEVVGALLGLVDLREAPRDDIAILAARVSVPVSEGPLPRVGAQAPAARRSR